MSSALEEISDLVSRHPAAEGRTVSCDDLTGIGEEFIRHGVAHSISDLMELRGLSLQAAAERVVHEVLRPGDGGVIAVGHDGTVAMVFNTEGMYRGYLKAGTELWFGCIGCGACVKSCPTDVLRLNPRTRKAWRKDITRA